MKDRTLCRMAVVSILCGLALSLLWGMGTLRRQEMLAREVIRLHVIAASDSAEDQELKLKVRDAVLAETEQILSGEVQRDEAEHILRKHLVQLQESAQATVRAAEHKDAVQVCLTEEEYPTRDYGTFSLPGGEYLSLQVVIGAGEGHNWWCVVFPPLCAACSVEELEESGLRQQDVALITRSSPEYEIRFKSIEIWETCRGVWEEWRG